jgi:hypothetical protein
MLSTLSCLTRLQSGRLLQFLKFKIHGMIQGPQSLQNLLRSCAQLPVPAFFLDDPVNTLIRWHAESSGSIGTVKVLV